MRRAVTVQIRFEESLPAYEEDLADLEPDTDVTALEHDLFWRNVRILVDGIDVLQLPGSPPGHGLPLIHASMVGRSAVLSALDGGRAVYSLPGSGQLQLLAMAPNAIRLDPGNVGNVAQADAAELATAWRDFGRDARRYLEQHFPQLMRRPDWELLWTRRLP